jgi:hypothetical protein
MMPSLDDDARSSSGGCAAMFTPAFTETVELDANTDNP